MSSILTEVSLLESDIQSMASPHVLFSDQQTDGGTSREAPVAAHKLQLRLDVVNEKGHVAVQVELGDLKDQRVAQYRHAADSVHLR